jgi:hypothetical protein
MTTENKEFKDYLSQLPSSLQEEIESAIEVSIPSSDIDEDYLQMMKEMSPETYETLLKGIDILKNQPIEVLKVLFSTKQEKDFEFLDDEEEDIIVWEGNYHSEENITFQNEKIIIINGNITCNNLIVNDSYLFVNGNVTCKVLFGASSNDKMTRITLNLKAKSVVENGHYTVVDGKIEAENIVMIHNEIKSNTAIEAKVIFESTEYESNKLNSLITDDDGYFDEDKFLEKINEDADFNILN